MAVMEEAGIAIYPGLYSLLAMEKTEVSYSSNITSLAVRNLFVKPFA